MKRLGVVIGMTMMMTGMAAVLPSGELLAQDPQLDDAEVRALELERKVLELTPDLTTYGRIADLYHEIAELREDTPDAARALAMAARFDYYAGDDDAAYDAYRRAGDLAIAWGDVLTAATAYADGAWVAHQCGRDEAALELALKVEKLTESPHLDDDDRETLRRRIGRAQ